MNKMFALLLNDFQKSTLRYALYQALMNDKKERERGVESCYSVDEHATLTSIYLYLAQEIIE